MAARNIPAYITFTGADDAAYCKGMAELSARYPIEWGILVDPDKNGVPLFPTAQHIDRIRKLGVRLCAHICGSLAANIAGGCKPTAHLAGFSRIQVNHGRDGADTDTVAAVSEFASTHGVRGVLQCRGPKFPENQTQVDWLYDVSFGEGVRPTTFPAITTSHPFCGISGGIGPQNVLETLDQVISVDPQGLFWIDMESGVRRDGVFDLSLCEMVCTQVYGR